MPFLDILQALVAFQALFFAAFLLIRRPGVPGGNRSLGLLLILLAVHMTSRLGIGAAPYAAASSFSHLFGYLYGPLFYLFIRSHTHENGRLIARHGLHLVPFLVFAGRWMAGLHPSWLCAAGMLISMATYLALCVTALRRHHHVARFTRAPVDASTLRWIGISVWLLVAVLFLDVLAFLLTVIWPVAEAGIMRIIVAASLLLYVNAFVLAALEKPRLFGGISREEEAIAAENVSAGSMVEASEEDRADAARIETFMRQERPYLKSEMTISELAASAGMSPRRLSVVINRCFRQNFSEYVNGYRVEEAKKRLLAADTRDESMLDTLFAAGFNSKSSFNSVFKRLTGVTPTQYRARNHS